MSRLDELLEAQSRTQKELIDATSDLVALMVARQVALEKRVFKLEDVVREILQRTAGIGQRVRTVPIVDGEDRAKRIREGEPGRESAMGASVDLGTGERPNSGGDGNSSSL